MCMAAGANCESLRLRTPLNHSAILKSLAQSAYLTRNRRFVLTIPVPYPLATIEYRYNEEEEIRGGVRQLPGIRRGPVNSAVFVAAMRKRSPLSTPVTHPSDNTWNVIDNALFATCAALTVPTAAAPRTQEFAMGHGPPRTPTVTVTLDSAPSCHSTGLYATPHSFLLFFSKSLLYQIGRSARLHSSTVVTWGSLMRWGVQSTNRTV